MALAAIIAAIINATVKTKKMRFIIHYLRFWAILIGPLLLVRTYSYTEWLFFISHLLGDAGSFVRL
jgi:hypothetical protein